MTETESKEEFDVEAELKAIMERIEKLEQKDDTPTEPEQEETPEDKPEETPAPEAENAEIKALRKELNEIKEFLNQPQYKSLTENMKAKMEEIKAKEISPLDEIR